VNNTTGIGLVESYTLDTNASHAANISTRGRVGVGDEVLIGGFIVTGSVPKTVAVRGIGPSLGAFGVPDPLADPTLELRGSNGALIIQNDNWQEDPKQAAQLTEGLASYDAWATGLRREETHNRVIAPVVGWDEGKQKVKISPLARWTQSDVDRYIAEHDVLVNPLQYDGYPSIGCWPCTRRVAPGDDARSGRWSGTGKTECGIHS